MLELLVAFTIMALSLGMLYKASGGAVKTVVDTEQAERATSLAHSLLSARDSVPPEGWNESGHSAEIDWRIQSSLYGSAPPGEPAVLHQVRISLGWRDQRGARSIELATLLPQAKPVPGERLK